ncbi:MAG: hypothetical protein A2039_09900 [Candidatus Melainabacteria bacterium GWA2_34_9]|nr:MAG: hypothetical protein A2039_09900 [Candidatus Melainabacteria bacterium GWA2_34_9]
MAVNSSTEETAKQLDQLLGQSIKKTYTTSQHGSNSDIQTLTIETMKPNFMMRNNCFIRKGVPESHRRVADSFMIIKKVFGYPVVQSKIIDEEKALLVKYDFNPLELSTTKQIEDELVFLKRWSYSRNRELQDAADQIIQIRAKELKYLIATRYVNTNKNYNGYQVLEKYFEEISKYFRQG